MAKEFVEKFGYRKYKGKTEARWKRIWNLARFELISTWYKSTFGKVILIIILVLNFMAITLNTAYVSSIANDPEFFPEEKDRDRLIRTALNTVVARYLDLGINIITPSNDIPFAGMNIGFLIIALFAIAGSGLFADDRQGRIVEIYLSKLQRTEYVIGKICAIFFYINIFATVPLLALGVVYVQALGENHLQYLDYYTAIIVYGLLVSFLYGLAILIFSSLFEKRNYASLGFYLTYLLGSIFGGLVSSQEEASEFLMLTCPSHFFTLLAYSILGEYELESVGKLYILNDGKGLEHFHILGLTFILIVIMTVFLFFKLHRLTTEELA
ncbi:MAG: hypothetical protein ACFFCQ_09445 [Promethearchaeota archaeon]